MMRFCKPWHHPTILPSTMLATVPAVRTTKSIFYLKFCIPTYTWGSLVDLCLQLIHHCKFNRNHCWLNAKFRSSIHCRMKVATKMLRPTTWKMFRRPLCKMRSTSKTMLAHKLISNPRMICPQFKAIKITSMITITVSSLDGILLMFHG